MRLKVLLVTDSGDTVEVQLDPRVAARIIQEEVWAQTVWPEGERSLEQAVRVLEEACLVTGHVDLNACKRILGESD